MNDKTLQFIKEQVELIEDNPKHGEVILKIKNGYVYRVVPSPDYLLKETIDKKSDVV